MYLKTEGLSKSFGNIHALKKASFGIEKGEIFGVAGPNGAGKSTMFNVIAGIYTPTAGKVFFEDKDITGLSSHKICHRGIGRTFQVPRTFHSLDVGSNLKAGMIFGKSSSRRLDEVTDLLDLGKKLHLPSNNLDLYTTKLVMLGTVLATDCRLLMLDEPMAGLSMVEIENFVKMVKKINKAWGTTILLIEHLLDVLTELAGQLLILDNGQMITLGDPKEVIKDERVVKSYLGGYGDE